MLFEARHKERLTHLKFIGILWLSVVVIGVGGFTLLQRAKQPSIQLTAIQEQADLLEKLSATCKENLAYQRQYADLTDIQTIRSLNSLNLHCQSLNNRYQAAVKMLTQ